MLNGRGRDHHARNFPGPLSIKSVLCGTAARETDEGRFEIGPGACLSGRIEDSGRDILPVLLQRVCGGCRAISAGHGAIVDLLPARSGNPDARTDDGKLPEDFARARSYAAVVEVLARARAAR
jgi:hypothetical protein